MGAILYFIIGVCLLFLGGKDPFLSYLDNRKSGKNKRESIEMTVLLFVLPWPRTVNKRMIWILAGFSLIVLSIVEVSN